MKFLHEVVVLLLISTLVLESEAWWSRRRRSSTVCPSPPTPAHTSISGCLPPYNQGDSCHYSCQAGYSPVSGSPDRTCSSGAWSGTNLICSASDWPVGTYGLPKTNTGCPEEAGVTWSEGYRFQDTEDHKANNRWSEDLHFDGGFWKNNMYQKFCMKTSSLNGTGNWPAGNYCIFKKAECPIGFQSGKVYWDDEDSDNKNNFTGALPDGQFDRNTLIEYCCRDDGSTNAYISLPGGKPFYLFRFGVACQNVARMNKRDEYFYWDDEDDKNNGYDSGAHPFDDGGEHNHKLHYCYYWPYSR